MSKRKVREALTLRDLLESRRGPNQIAWLARQLGISRQSVLNMFANEVVNTSTLQSLAGALGGRLEVRLVFSDETWVVRQFRQRRRRTVRRVKVSVVSTGVGSDLRGVSPNLRVVGLLRK